MIQIITKRAFSIVAALSLALLCVLAPSAHAGPYDGKVVTSDKRIPTSASSKSAYFAKVRQQAKTKFAENKEKKEWKVYFAAFFQRPLNDLEVTIKLYDVTDKKQKVFKAGFQQFLSERKQTSVISDLKLSRKEFGVNRKILIEVESRGRVLAKGTFDIQGEAEKFSGKVEFSEDEAANGAKEEE